MTVQLHLVPPNTSNGDPKLARIRVAALSELRAVLRNVLVVHLASLHSCFNWQSAHVFIILPCSYNTRRHHILLCHPGGPRQP